MIIRAAHTGHALLSREIEKCLEDKEQDQKNEHNHISVSVKIKCDKGSVTFFQ